nr:TlpA disulfide reductase family protein [Pedobacter panaciterrae]
MKVMKFLVLLMLLSSEYKASAQTVNNKFPQIGDRIEDHTFTDLVNYHDKSFKISDYKGKWLVLDFWSRWCSSCIATFPKMNKLSQEFYGKVKLVLVGVYDHSENRSEELLIKETFNRRRKRYGFDIAVAFDSIAGRKYCISTVPAIFVINPNGILVAKSIDIDSSQLAIFLKGYIPNYERSYSLLEKKHDGPYYRPKIPLLTNTRMSNGGVDTSFIARSIIAKWQPGMAEYILYGWSDKQGIGGSDIPGWAEAIGQNLNDLFRLAYTGESGWSYASNDSLYRIVSRKLILEIVDSTSFKESHSDKRFGYSLKMPVKHSDPSLMRRTLLDDLHRYFNLKSYMETRLVDVYKLVVIDKKKLMKLQTKGGEKKYISNGFTTKFRNYPLSEVIKGIGPAGLDVVCQFNINKTPPILSYIGTDFNVDWDYNADLRDWNECLELLRKNGMDLKMDKAEMKCIVIKDANK